MRKIKSFSIPKPKNLKIILRLEKDGKYIEERLTPRMICALFDLNYMLTPDVWETIKLNKMSKELSEFFKIIELLDDSMHGNLVGEYHKGKLIIRKKTKGEYIFGKPEWRDIK